MSHRKYLIVINLLLQGALPAAQSNFVVKQAEEKRRPALQVPIRNELRPADFARIWKSSGCQCTITIRDRKQQSIISMVDSAFFETAQAGIAAPAWNLEGAVSSDYRRITWSDGTIWSR